MKAAVAAGIAYFLVVFAIGFVLGAIRVSFLAPAIGSLRAVMTEMPFMLAASWVVCGYIIRRLRVDGRLSTRSIMGICAFACLMLAEFALATMLFDLNPSQHLARYAEPDAALGLIGQLLFGALPVVRHRAQSDGRAD